MSNALLPESRLADTLKSQDIITPDMRDFMVSKLWIQENDMANIVPDETFTRELQNLMQNPENQTERMQFLGKYIYDRLIAEVQKGGKDPLEVAQEKWRKDEFIMSLDSYINSKNKQTIKTIRNEWQEMDHTNYWKEKKLIESTRLILVSMKALESQKKFGAEQIRDINIMYTNSSSPEVREMIKRDFWQYIKDDKIARL